MPPSCMSIGTMIVPIKARLATPQPQPGDEGHTERRKIRERGHHRRHERRQRLAGQQKKGLEAPFLCLRERLRLELVARRESHLPRAGQRNRKAAGRKATEIRRDALAIDVAKDVECSVVIVEIAAPERDIPSVGF